MAVIFNNVVPHHGNWEKAMESFKQDVIIYLKNKFGNDTSMPKMKLDFPKEYSKKGVQIRIEGDTSRLFVYSDSLVKFFKYSDCDSNRDLF